MQFMYGGFKADSHGKFKIDSHGGFNADSHEKIETRFNMEGSK